MARRLGRHLTRWRELRENDVSMRPIVYSMQFRGDTRPSAPGFLDAAMTAPSCALVTTIDGDGLHGRFEPAPGAEASFRLHICFAVGDGYDESGTLGFGAGHALHLRSVGSAVLGGSPNPHLRHGTLMWQVTSGEGQFENAEGRISSNFFVSDTGEVTDNQIGVIFVNGRA
jgi:hypothetical protein